MKQILFLIIFLLLLTDVNGQANALNAKTPSDFNNNYSSSNQKKEFLDYENVDEKNILWSKVVYEFIDLDEKLNFPLLFPTVDANSETKYSLWKVIKENILNGNINEVYREDNDNFIQSAKIVGERREKTIEEMEFLDDWKSNLYWDNGDAFIHNYNIAERFLAPYEPETEADNQGPPFATSADIYGYLIKGIWYFDKLHAELRYRLLGLMPYGTDMSTYFDGEQEEAQYFWIWYPSIRQILDNYYVFNDKNNNNRISFDELLINRRFSSYIYKYDNVYGDRDIRSYIKRRVDQGESEAQWKTRIIMESERIKKEILDFEIDMWGY